MKLHDKAQAAMDKVIAQMEAGDLSAIVKAASTRIEGNGNVPAAKWSLSNRVLALVTTGDLDARGYKQWQAVGRQVKKGESCGYILVPLTRKASRENSNGKSEEYFYTYGFKAVSVFGISQTEGEPLVNNETFAPPPLFEVAEALNCEVHYGPALDNSNGAVTVNGKKMLLHNTSPAIFFHELAHLANMQFEQLSDGQHTDQEATAELTAAVLSEMYGVDYTGNAWHYISHYSKDPLQAIQRAVSKVQKVLDVIFTLAEGPNFEISEA